MAKRQEPPHGDPQEPSCARRRSQPLWATQELAGRLPTHCKQKPLLDITRSSARVHAPPRCTPWRVATDRIASIEASTGRSAGTDREKSAKNCPAPSPVVTARNRALSPTTSNVVGTPAGATRSPPGSTAYDLPSTSEVTRPSSRNSTPDQGEA